MRDRVRESVPGRERERERAFMYVCVCFTSEAKHMFIRLCVTYMF